MRRTKLSGQADADFFDILVSSYDSFGRAARDRYAALIETALADLAADPFRSGVKMAPWIGSGICTYHLRHSRERAMTKTGAVRAPRHLLLFRYDGGAVIGVGRILHDAMDIERHLPNEYGDEA